MSNVPKSTLRIISIMGIVLVLIIGYQVISGRLELVIPNEEFEFISTPQNGQTGGLEGIFYHENSRDCYREGSSCFMSYVLLRFFDNGDVVAVGVRRPELTGRDLRELETWFHGGYTGDEEFPQGQYFTSEKTIWFSIGYSNGRAVADYYGIILDNTMVLDVHNYMLGPELDNAVFSQLRKDE